MTALTVTAVITAGDGTTKHVVLTGSLNTAGAFEVGVDVPGNDVRHQGGNAAAIAAEYAVVIPPLSSDGSLHGGSRLKFFDGGAGIQTAVEHWRDGTSAPREPHPVFCVQVFSLDRTNPQTDINVWMDTLNFQCGLVLKQEFSADVLKGNYTAAAYSGWYAQLRAAIDAHPNGHYVDLQMVGSEAAERTAAGNGDPPIWAGVTVPHDTAVGDDTYVTQPGMLVAANAFAGSIGWYQACLAKKIPGVTLRISEGGISRVNFTNAQRLTAFNSAIAYLKGIATTGGSYNYWAGDDSTADPAKDWSYDKAGDTLAPAIGAAIAQNP